MRPIAYLFGFFVLLGIAGALGGNIDHLWFTVLPSGVMCIASVIDYRIEKRQENQLKHINHLKP